MNVKCDRIKIKPISRLNLPKKAKHLLFCDAKRSKFVLCLCRCPKDSGMEINMKKEKLEYLSHLFIVILGAALATVLFLRHVLVAVLPFALAWLVAVASCRPAEYLSEKTRLPVRILRIIISAVATLVTAALTVALARLAFDQLWGLLTGLADGGELSAMMRSLSEQVLGIFGRLKLPDEVKHSLTEALSGMVGRVLSGLGGILTSAASAVPGILLFLAVTVIAVIYFAWDLEGISAAVRTIMPPKCRKMASAAKDGMMTVTGKYIRSYALLMLITFAEMLIGFLILGVRYAFIFAVIISILDLLPIVGVGTALVPASVFCFLSGRGGLGVGILILFAVSVIVRELAEPRILGKNLGVHPLLTLVSMYVGYSFFGFAGILILPLFVIAFGIYKNNSSKVGEPAA